MTEPTEPTEPATARATAGLPVLTTQAGLRWQLASGEAGEEELEVLGAALDRLAAIEAGGRLSEWVTSSRPGAGVRAWAPGTRWSHSVRGEWGRGL